MKENFYLVISEGTYDGDDYREAKAFHDYTKAKKYFDEAVAEEKENDHLASSDSAVIEETDTSFCMYEDGEYCLDHINIEIKEMQFED